MCMLVCVLYKLCGVCSLRCSCVCEFEVESVDSTAVEHLSIASEEWDRKSSASRHVTCMWCVYLWNHQLANRAAECHF